MANVEPTYGWDAERTRFWLAHLAALETPLIPVARAIFSAVDLQLGERVLDVGCGAGVTAIEAADRVGPDGRVWGIDISPEMIDAARDRSAASNLEWVVADAAEYHFPPDGFDAIVESHSAQGVLAGQPEEIVDEARTALIEGLAPWHDGTGIALPGGFLMITARRR